MFVRRIVLLFLSSVLLSPILNASTTKNNNQLHRRLVIISDKSEHVGKSAGAATCELIGALHNAVSPILVSVSVWQNFIEKCISLASGAALEEEEEKCAYECVETIRSMLKSPENNIKNICPHDPIMAKHIVVDRINAALEALQQDNGEIELSDRVMDYLRCFQLTLSTHDWDLYKVTNSYYLAMPHEYKKWCLQEVSAKGVSESDIESALGLVVDHLELVSDPSNIDWVYFSECNDDESHLLTALQKVFLPSKGSCLSYVWNIYLCGHGINSEWLQKHCPGLSTIANMRPADFREILNFFDDNVSTNSLWYQTCEGGGLHMQEVIAHNNQKERSFSIVSMCLTDTPSYGHGIGVVDSLVKGILSAQDIEWDTETNAWRLVFSPKKMKRDLEEFFSLIEENTFNDDRLDWIRSAATSIAPGYIENIPLVLRANSKEIITIYPDTGLKLSKEYCEYLHSVSRPVKVDAESTPFILLGEPNVDILLKIISEKVPLLISVVPGKAVHHLAKITAESSYVEELIKMFRPLSGVTFDKTFVIDEITCKLDTEKKYGPLLQSGDGEFALFKDVVITHKYDKLIRFFFKNTTDDLFKAYMTCNADRKKVHLHGFKKIEDEQVKEAYELYRKKLINPNHA